MSVTVINVKIVETCIEFTDLYKTDLQITFNFESADDEFHWSVPLNRLESLLKALSVNRYEDIKNSYARLKLDDKGNILSIGHIVNDYWLSKVYVPEVKKPQYNDPSNKQLYVPVDEVEAPKVRCTDCKCCVEGEKQNHYCAKGVVSGPLCIDALLNYEPCPVFERKVSDKSE